LRLCRELSRSRRHARCQRLTKRARTAMTTGTPATIGEAGAAAPLVARRCQNHPRTSVLTQRTSWYPPHLTHVLAPVVCRAARGRAADRRRAAPRGTRLSEKRAAVTQRRNFPKRSFPKSNSLPCGHAVEQFSKKKLVTRRSCSGEIFLKIDPTPGKTRPSLYSDMTEITNVALLDLTGATGTDLLDKVTGISNVACILVPERLMGKLMAIPMEHIAATVPIPDGKRVKV